MNLRDVSQPTTLGTDAPASQWQALDDGVFEIHHYDRLPPFASFLPGVAGLRGAPLWCMYVNRGQAVCSFGYEDKDHSIGEFFSATWAYQLAGTYGFRTFILEKDNCHEPFARYSPCGESGRRTMRIKPHALVLIDENKEAQWRVEVEYCAVTDSIVPALRRNVRITNLSMESREIRLADGLPMIVPAGVSDSSLKKLRRITEAFIRVGRHHCGAATFVVPTTMKDEARVEAVEDVVFYGSWLRGNGTVQAMPMAIDPDAFFGPGSSFVRPEHFIDGTFDVDRQQWMNRLPCAMALANLEIGPEETIEFGAYAGFARNARMLDDFVALFCQPDIQDEVERNCDLLVQDLSRPGFAMTASPELNGYARQNFLDNVLRGGTPYLFPSRRGELPVHVYTRRHGDLERDYNHFELPPHPFSEGSGNFRDILQNRRHDSWFFPQAGAMEIKAFVELIQADGYNPLTVQGYRWSLPDEQTARKLCPVHEEELQRSFVQLTLSPFSPGELLLWLTKNEITCSDAESLLQKVLESCDARLFARSDAEGYWIDHWTYILDMLEAHQAIQPEEHDTLLKEKVGWFEPTSRVLPRAKRYRLQGRKARQYVALAPRPVTDRTEPWPGTSIVSKLVAMVAIKAITLDPEGRGMEMEAGRPGWNDALNGLPGLFGSATGETASLARLCRYLLDRREALGSIELPGPAADLLRRAIPIMTESKYNWEAAADLREAYREAAYSQRTVSMEALPMESVQDLLHSVEALCLRGLDSSRINRESPLVHTFFHRDGLMTPDNEGTISPAKFQAQPLPLFLEGQIHLLRLATDSEEARNIYRAIRQSPLRDQKLAMYVLNEDITSCSQEIGRIQTFSRGIYENESVWLHMSYKLLVELLRNELYDEFFEEATTMLVPFMPPEQYGRSIYENSSYIASSSCPDHDAHGRGFVARLSGSTAEFIHIWMLLTVGRRPFDTVGGELRFRLKPALPSRWFSLEPTTIEWNGRREILPENTLACALFGRVLLVYHNKSLRNTWGENGARVRSYNVDGELFHGEYLVGDMARRIRNREALRLDVVLE